MSIRASQQSFNEVKIITPIADNPFRAENKSHESIMENSLFSGKKKESEKVHNSTIASYVMYREATFKNGYSPTKLSVILTIHNVLVSLKDF